MHSLNLDLRKSKDTQFLFLDKLKITRQLQSTRTIKKTLYTYKNILRHINNFRSLKNSSKNTSKNSSLQADYQR